MAVDIDLLASVARDPGRKPVLRVVEPHISSNDNTVAAPASEAETAMRDFADPDYGDSSADRSSPIAKHRRRGPLITRWIGFANRRQRAQSRLDRRAQD